MSFKPLDVTMTVRKLGNFYNNGYVNQQNNKITFYKFYNKLMHVGTSCILNLIIYLGTWEFICRYIQHIGFIMMKFQICWFLWLKIKIWSCCNYWLDQISVVYFSVSEALQLDILLCILLKNLLWSSSHITILAKG